MYVFVYLMASRLLRNVPRAALAVLAFSSTILIPTDEIHLQRFFFLWGIFLIGELAAEHAPLFFALFRRRYLIPFGVAALLLAGLAATGADVLYREALLIPTLAGLVVFCAFAVFLERLPQNRLLKALAFVGRNSHVYYLVHVPTLYLVTQVFLASGMGSAWLLLASNLVFAVVLSSIFAVLNERVPAVGVLFAVPRLSRRPSRPSRNAPAGEERADA